MRRGAATQRRRRRGAAGHGGEAMLPRADDGLPRAGRGPSLPADAIASATKAAASVLAAITARRNVLVVLDRSDIVSAKSLRNLPTVHVIWVDQLNAYDVLLSDDLVFTKAAFDAYTKKEA